MPLFSPQLMKRKRNQNQLFNYFWKMLLTFEGKKLEIHRHRWLSIIWIFKKVNSILTLVKDILEIKLSHWSLLSKTYKKSHSITRTPIASNKFVFYPNNCLVPLRILSYRESTVAVPISSLVRCMYKILFSFSWLAI